MSSVPTTAECEAVFDVACYGPAQLQQAYNLPTLYSKGINGKGTTIAIVDPFGSPTIKSDLYALGAMFIFVTLFLPRGVMGLFRARTPVEPEPEPPAVAAAHEVTG